VSKYSCVSPLLTSEFGVELDRLNIIFIDIRLGVRPDSTIILQAAKEVVEEEGFDKLLQDVKDRIDEVESLERTREITVRLCNYLMLRCFLFPNSSRTLPKGIQFDSQWIRVGQKTRTVLLLDQPKIFSPHG
jgi:hypothetical protein